MAHRWRLCLLLSVIAAQVIFSTSLRILAGSTLDNRWADADDVTAVALQGHRATGLERLDAPRPAVQLLGSDFFHGRRLNLVVPSPAPAYGPTTSPPPVPPSGYSPSPIESMPLPPPQYQDESSPTQEPPPSPQPNATMPLPPSPMSPDTPSPEASPAPSPQPFPVPSPEPSPVPSPAPSPIPSPKPSPTPSPEPSPSPSPKPSPSPSPSPFPSPSPSPKPSPKPTPKPSPNPSPESSPTPSPEPSPTPPPDSSPIPSPEPSPTQLPESSPTPSSEPYSAPSSPAPLPESPFTSPPESQPLPPPPPQSPSPSPTPSETKDLGALVCTGREGACLSANATSGAALDTFLLTASGWQSAAAAYPAVLYEFGVMTIVGASALYKARQEYSTSATAPLVGLPVGNTTMLYVCVRAANSKLVAVGPRACATVTVQISNKATESQVRDQVSSLRQALTALPSTSAALELTERLAAVAAVSNGTNANTASLASGLLSQLLSTSANGTTDTASLLMIFGGMSTLWSMADSTGRATATDAIRTFSEKLSSQALSAEDAQPVAIFFTQMLDGAMDTVTASAASSNGNGGDVASRKVAALGLLASITRGAAALTRGLLNNAPTNGSAVYVNTASLSAAVQRASATLAAAGIVMSLPTPGNSASATRRRQLLSSDFPASAAVSVALNPAVGSLCDASTACAADGLGLTVTVMGGTSLLIAALGGSTVSLAANLSDYRVGGSVQIISPIVRIAAPGLPASAVGLSSLLVLDLPVNVTAIAQSGASTRRALVRLQDIGAAPVDESAGITAAASTTSTLNSVASSGAAALISGYSNALGDFVVVQYEITAVPTAGESTPSLPVLPSPTYSPQVPSPGGAAAALPFSMLTAALVGLATLLSTLML